MKQHKCPATHPTLEEVQKAFEQWRKERPSRTTIPPALWEAAVALSENYSIHKISKTLRLNHTELKTRAASRNNEGKAPLESPYFIELPVAVPAGDAPQCALEMENRHGEKIRICFTDMKALDFLALANVFWSTRS